MLLAMPHLLVLMSVSESLGCSPAPEIILYQWAVLRAAYPHGMVPLPPMIAQIWQFGWKPGVLPLTRWYDLRYDSKVWFFSSTEEHMKCLLPPLTIISRHHQGTALSATMNWSNCQYCNRPYLNETRANIPGAKQYTPANHWEDAVGNGRGVKMVVRRARKNCREEKSVQQKAINKNIHDNISVLAYMNVLKHLVYIWSVCGNHSILVWGLNSHRSLSFVVQL